MKNILFLVVASLLTVHRSQALEYLAKPRYKSFQDAVQECATNFFITNATLQRYAENDYPDEPSFRKVINCVMVVVNAWNEQTQLIMDHVFSQFFIPSTTVCRYRQNTKKCLEYVKLVDSKDRLGRAFYSFKCYYHNYAGISPEAKWIPYTDSVIQQVLVDSMRIVPHSRQSLVEYCQGRVLAPPEYPELAYVYTTRLGFYDNFKGVDLDRLYLQFGNVNLLSEPTKECVNYVSGQFCKEPDRVFSTILVCLYKYIPVIQIVSTAARTVLGNPVECVLPAKPRPKTKPCYNCHCALNTV